MHQLTLQQQTRLQQIGSLSIASIPGGAKIFIDGNEQTDTTPAIIELPIGPHTHLKLLDKDM